MAPKQKPQTKSKKNMGGTSDGHMVPNKQMKGSGDKMPKKFSKKGY